MVNGSSFLETEGMEKSYAITQHQVKEVVDLQTARKVRTVMVITARQPSHSSLLGLAGVAVVELRSLISSSICLDRTRSIIRETEGSPAKHMIEIQTMLDAYWLLLAGFCYSQDARDTLQCSIGNPSD